MKSGKSNAKGKAKKAKVKPAAKENKVDSRNCRSELIEQWWSIDSWKNNDACGVENLKGAAALVKSSLLENPSWKLESVIETLEGYQQFLLVLKHTKDWYCQKLAPCALVDHMWSTHSEMDNYGSDMKFLLGRFVPYKPFYEDEIDDGSMPVATREQRTIEVIQSRFGEKSLNKSVWGVVLIQVDRSDGNEELPYYFHEKTEHMSSVLAAWAEDEGLSVQDFNFFYNKHQIHENDTPLMLGLARANTILAYPKNRFPISVRDKLTGDEKLYTHDPSGILSWLMDTHAELSGIDRSSLVFTFKGKRIFGHEHLREFNMNHYDVIETVPLESYRCSNCICCNLKQEHFKLG